MPAGLLLTAGASYNRLRYRISRLSDAATSPNGYELERKEEAVSSGFDRVTKDRADKVRNCESIG